MVDYDVVAVNGSKLGCGHCAGGTGVDGRAVSGADVHAAVVAVFTGNGMVTRPEFTGNIVRIRRPAKAVTADAERSTAGGLA